MASNVNVHISEFSDKGLDLSKDPRVLTYLYGLSDFWASTFSDVETVNLLLGANSFTASEVYSNFLQLTSGISLADVSEMSESQIKLSFISTANKVIGGIETYKLTDKISYARFLCNRPFLPTSTLEEEVDYYIDVENSTISFAKPISSYSLPFRLNTDGSKEYSAWFVDARVDSDILYNNFAKLIGVDKPDRTSEVFKNYVYGLYYMYVNGPNLSIIRRGLNLTLGVPLARETEVVLEIRKYLSSDQYIVITDLNSYLIPYGLEATVEVGETIQLGDEISSWVEVKDYINDGDWWLNFMVPSSLIPDIPTDIPDRNRYATAGSYADYIMRNYLKTHTFLVNVKTVGFKNIQGFQQLSSIISSIKPSYTSPIYVWTVPSGSEIIDINDDDLKFSKHITRCQAISSGMYRFKRGNLSNPLDRSCPQFTRYSVPAVLDEHMGFAPEINGLPRTLDTGFVDGFRNPQSQFRDMSREEDGWTKALFRRDNSHYMPLRSQLGFTRTLPYDEVEGTGSDPILDNFPGKRLICLFTTTMLDILDKFNLASKIVPNKYMFTLFEPEIISSGINEVSLNGSESIDYYNFILSNFDKYFKRHPDVNYVGPFCAKDNYRIFTPKPADIQQGDFLVFVKIVDYAVGVFWATSNMGIFPDPYWANEGDDTLSMDISGKLARGMGPLGSPIYLLRSAGIEATYSEGSSINTEELDSMNPSSAIITKVNYSDNENLPMIMDRSGRSLITRKIMR